MNKIFYIWLLSTISSVALVLPARVIECNVQTTSTMINTTLQVETTTGYKQNFILHLNYLLTEKHPTFNKGDTGTLTMDWGNFQFVGNSPSGLLWGVNGHPTETAYSNYIATNVVTQIGYLQTLGCKYYICSFEGANYPSIIDQTVPQMQTAGITVIPEPPITFDTTLTTQKIYQNNYNSTYSWATYAISKGYNLPYWQISNEIENWGLVGVVYDGANSNWTETKPGAFSAIVAGLNGAYNGIHQAFKDGRAHQLTTIEPQVLFGATYRHWGLLSQIKGLNGTLPCDIIYWHWYGPNYGLFSKPINDTKSFSNGRSAAQCLADFHRPIWITEVGRSANVNGKLYNGSISSTIISPVTQDYASQANQLKVDIDDIRSVPSVRAVFCYELLDEPGAGVSQGYFGLVTGLNGTKKTAFQTYQTEIKQ